MDGQFIHGKELARLLALAIEPALRELLPNTPLALAFIGAGSDVLGYDTARSMDHDWGPRLTIVVPEPTLEDATRLIDAKLDDLMPSSVAGFPTQYSRHDDNSLFPDPHGKVHRLEVTSTHRILLRALGIGALDALTPAVWLSTPMQSLLEVTAGEVFVDDARHLTAIRNTLGFYPYDVWRYQLSALWMRVGQVQPFIGRTGEVGDDAGSATITASIARDLMRIALLQSGKYAPYAKWLGTAFARSNAGSDMRPHLEVALASGGWQGREAGINRAGRIVIQQLNGLGIILKVHPHPQPIHARPFHVLPAEEIANALHGSLAGSRLVHLPPFVGGIDMITDSTDALKSDGFRSAVRTMFANCLTARM